MSAAPPGLDEAQTAALEQVRVDARVFAASLNTAEEAGISHSVLLPELIGIMRETGLLPKTGGLPLGLGRLLGG